MHYVYFSDSVLNTLTTGTRLLHLATTRRVLHSCKTE